MILYTGSVLNTRKQINFREISLLDHAEEIKYLTIRLFLQLTRRPSGFMSGLIQPLLWLLLFGGLFHDIPLNSFGVSSNYGPFLSCGIIVFTSFTGSLNAGLPLVFDREFGFLNRLLTSPIMSKYSVMLSVTIFIICVTTMQDMIIVTCSLKLFHFSLSYYAVCSIILVLLLITCSISSLSLGLAFILPGHIEFIALTLIINLPMLFASTALAPIYFMPYWLQIIAKLNLLTYAIEAIRFIVFNHINTYEQYLIKLLDYQLLLSLDDTIKVLALTALISFLITEKIVSNKIE